ncbi:ABC transporter substrate-binding protein [Parachitinimonas caeni]|uniref:ABC transporter substrate-binding protein n=1 Tax=Parachitinimonas caeni TaxID=3031301 RepID=A0ABT7DYR1_9NEIS|nr:ABC transporter substrate-binding protein [Parachitinimonas caeni]MDK2125144.1 ABC transporter substrate-binding protein [Parachitinimonas caeni]
MSLRLLQRSRRQLVMVALALLTGTAGAGNHTVTDALGRSLSVPDQPKRVLALSELDLDALLALQQKPVGTTNGRGQDGPPRYLGTAAQGISSVGAFASPVLDRVIAARPDLILAGGQPDPALLSQLGKIAPTVVSYQLGEDWQTALRRIASLVGQGAQSEGVIAHYQQRLAQTRQRLGHSKGANVSVVRWNPQGPAYMLKDAFASRVLADLGLQRPAGQQQPGIAHSPPLSLEALNRIDGDWLFVGTLSAKGQASDALAAARQTPAFQQLQVFKKNRVVEVDGSLWTGLGGPLAALAVLADVEKALGKP